MENVLSNSIKEKFIIFIFHQRNYNSNTLLNTHLLIISHYIPISNETMYKELTGTVRPYCAKLTVRK